MWAVGEPCLIDRYTLPAMGRIWTEENKYRCWLKVESAASDVLAEDGVIPASAAEAISTRASFDVARIQDRKSTRLNSSHSRRSRMPSSA